MNETDRELLELAAKTAGINGFLVDSGLNTGSNAIPIIWNPLTDDGDALRLAVKLRLETEFGSNFVNIGQSQEPGEWHLAQESGIDLCSATRRAIVRAAAAIGKAMQ